jgi:hypothetical protein
MQVKLGTSRVSFFSNYTVLHFSAACSKVSNFNETLSLAEKFMACVFLLLTISLLTVV